MRFRLQGGPLLHDLAKESRLSGRFRALVVRGLGFVVLIFWV